MKYNFNPVQEQLLGLLKKYNLKEPFWEYEIKENWSKILPKQLATVTEPVKVEKGVLSIRVKNELWKKEILQRKAELLNLIQSAVNGISIKEIDII